MIVTGDPCGPPCNDPKELRYDPSPDFHCWLASVSDFVDCGTNSKPFATFLQFVFHLRDCGGLLRPCLRQDVRGERPKWWSLEQGSDVGRVASNLAKFPERDDVVAVRFGP